MTITEYIGILCVTLADGQQYLQQGTTVWHYASRQDIKGTCLETRTDGTRAGLLALVCNMTGQDAPLTWTSVTA